MPNFYQTYFQNYLLQRPAFIGLAIGLTIHVLIFYYLERLRKENCECALTTDYRVLRALNLFRIAYIIAVFVLLMVVQSGLFPVSIASRILTILVPILFIVSLAFLILSLKYIIRLYKIACQCADNSLRLVYLIYVVYLLGISMAFFVMLFACYLQGSCFN